MDLFGIALIASLFGKKSGSLTIMIAFVFAGFDWFFQFIPSLTGSLHAHPIFAAILGGVLLGWGEGLLIRQNISSGIDASIALVVQDKFKISPSFWFTVTDAIILTSSYLLIPELNFLPTILAVMSANLVLALFEPHGKLKLIPSRRGAVFVPLWLEVVGKTEKRVKCFYRFQTRKKEVSLLPFSFMKITEPIIVNDH